MDPFVKDKICFLKISVVVFVWEASHKMILVWEFLIHPSDWIIYTSHYCGSWVILSLFLYSLHPFFFQMHKDLGHQPVADVSIKVLGLRPPRHKNYIEINAHFSPRLPRGLLVKIMSYPKKEGVEVTWRKREIPSPTEKLVIKKWIPFMSIQGVLWNSGSGLEILSLYSTCCISSSISTLILWAPLIHQMGF